MLTAEQNPQIGGKIFALLHCAFIHAKVDINHVFCSEQASERKVTRISIARDKANLTEKRSTSQNTRVTYFVRLLNLIFKCTNSRLILAMG